MRISPSISGSFGAITAPDADESRSPNVAPVIRTPAITDSVQISDAGRARAAGQGSVSDLDAAREARIRHAILNGAYNTLDVVDEVARRILDSGDL